MTLYAFAFRENPDKCVGAGTFTPLPRSAPPLPSGAPFYWRIPQIPVSPIALKAETPAPIEWETREFRVSLWRSDSMPAVLPIAVRIR